MQVEAHRERDGVPSHVAPQDLEASYRDMAADQGREQEALEWSEGVIVGSSSLTEPRASR